MKMKIKKTANWEKEKKNRKNQKITLSTERFSFRGEICVRNVEA